MYVCISLMCVGTYKDTESQQLRNSETYYTRTCALARLSYMLMTSCFLLLSKIQNCAVAFFIYILLALALELVVVVVVVRLIVSVQKIRYIITSAREKESI